MNLTCPKCQQKTRTKSTEQTPTEIHRWLVCNNCKFKFRTIEKYYLVKADTLNKHKVVTQRQQGVSNHAAVLQEQDVIRLRTMSKQGATSTELAKVFGMSQSHINRILRYDAWKHI